MFSYHIYTNNLKRNFTETAFTPAPIKDANSLIHAIL